MAEGQETIVLQLNCSFLMFVLAAYALVGCAVAPSPAISPKALTDQAQNTLNAYRQSESEAPLTLADTVALTVVNNLEITERKIELAISQGDVRNYPLLDGLGLTAARSKDTQDSNIDHENEIVARIDSLAIGTAYYEARLQQTDAQLKAGLVEQSAQVRALEAVQLYYELAAHQAMERKVLDMLSDLQEAKQANREVIEQRLGDPLAALGAALELGELEASLLDKLRAAIQLRDQFRKLVGRLGSAPVELDLALVEQPQLPALPATPESLTAVMLVARYDVLATYLEEDKARDEYRRTLVSWLPTASLEFTEEFGSDSEDFRAWRLSWNLLNVVKLAIADDVYALRMRLVELSRDRAILALDQDLQSLFALSRQSRLQYNVRVDNAQLSGETFDALTSQAQFRSGRLVLLKSQLNLIEAQFNRDMALATHMTDVAQLGYASGIPLVPANWSSLSFDALVSEVRSWEAWSWQNDG